MNVKLIAIVVSFAAISSQANAILTAPARTGDSSTKILLTCPVARTPQLQDIASVIGTTNFWSTYNARVRVVELAKQACERGAVAVSIVSAADPADNSLASTRR